MPPPRAPSHSAFDAGDYGLGLAANSLELGCDCLGHVHYFDGVCNDSKGQPYVIKNAVCLHEEDYGLLWKHVDYRWGGVAAAAWVRAARGGGHGWWQAVLCTWAHCYSTDTVCVCTPQTTPAGLGMQRCAAAAAWCSASS